VAGTVPGWATTLGGGHALASGGRVSGGADASCGNGLRPVRTNDSNTTRPTANTAAAPPANHFTVRRARVASSIGAASGGGAGVSGGVSKPVPVTAPARQLRSGSGVSG
jgi:hypothetical protein